MQFLGESLALAVAFMWTATALCFEYASKRTGALPLNLIRLVMASMMSGLTLWITTGQPIPFNAGPEAWFWLAISGLIGFVFGDYCLFQAYVMIGSRFTQLMMTLAPPSAAIFGAMILSEEMSVYGIAGMVVTILGIILSIVGRSDNDNKFRIKLPLKGLLLAMGAGIGQGVGIVFSKLGMEYFRNDLIARGADQTTMEMIPFAASQIRIITGIIGFFLIIIMTRQLPAVIRAIGNHKAMGVAAMGTFFGPFLGVSMSLMAIQYTQTGIASTLMALSPVIILLPAYFYFKQKVTLIECAGAMMSVVGVCIFFLA